MESFTNDSFPYNSDYSVYDDDYTLQEDGMMAHTSKDFEPLDSETDFSQSFSSVRDQRYRDDTRSKTSARRKIGSHTKPPPAPPSFQGSASFSTIPSSERDSSVPSEVKEVYQELHEINLKLKDEYKVLQDRLCSVKEREKMAAQTEARLEQSIEAEVQRRMALREQELQLDIERLENALRERNKENKRLQENFNTLKTANDVLRREVESLQTQHDRLEKQSHSLQSRLTNLQRKQENEDRKEGTAPQELLKSKTVNKREIRERHLRTKAFTGNDVMGMLLEWVSDFHLRLAISDQPSKQPTCPADFIQEKCLKIFPQLVEILKEVATQNSKFVLPCLQFMYWSLLHLDQGKGHQKSALSSTLRRLGEELYRPRPARVGDESDRPQEAFFFRSQDPSIRFLSSLIILKTISQVDHLAHVFDVLRNDLKTEGGKELFIHYQATPVILHHLRPMNKALMNSALDILLQLSMECEQLPAFLDSCSNETWFRAVANVWRVNNAEQKVLEKLSIILQKLSKLKSNRKYFEVFGLTTSAQELVRTLNSDQDAAFLNLNLKSILFNLNANKPAT